MRQWNGFLNIVHLYTYTKQKPMYLYIYIQYTYSVTLSLLYTLGCVVNGKLFWDSVSLLVGE